MPPTTSWHLRSEGGYIYLYKGDVKLNRSECLAGKGTEDCSNMDLGPVLEIKKVEDNKVKVSLAASS